MRNKRILNKEIDLSIFISGVREFFDKISKEAFLKIFLAYYLIS